MKTKNVKKIAKDVIQYEINALKNLKKYVGSNFNEILKKLKFPVFVKPSNSGSSLGISKV